MATVHAETQACSGSPPKLDRGQRRIFVRGQGEAVLALRRMESKEEGLRDKQMHGDGERERPREGGRKKRGRNDNRLERRHVDTHLITRWSAG